MIPAKELQTLKELLEAVGHIPKLNTDGTLWLDYDRLDYHIDAVCTTCYESWCIYCIDLENNSDLIEPCEALPC